jgi:formylglycine-generating enzyme required for sulfatase activity
MANRSELEQILSRAKMILSVLETQSAGYANLTIPAQLKVQLDEKRQEVESLEARLAQLQGGNKAVDVPDKEIDKYLMATLTIQKEQRTAQYFREKLGDKIELDMILVYGGNFLMGSPETEEGHNNNESPQHPVNVKSFFLGHYPVTQAQWRIVAETYDQVNIELNPDPSQFKGSKRPVEQVSWYEAQEYCDRLAKKTKRPYRLPTEAEWEYACRAGTTTPFYFGNTISTELVNYYGNYTYANGVKGENRNETTPVDHFDIANAWGLYDIHGNVCQWCQDHWHSNYEGAPEDGSAWLTDNSEANRVIRGGCWITDPRNCRSASRHDHSPDGRNFYLGFRVSFSSPPSLQHSTEQS